MSDKDKVKLTVQISKELNDRLKVIAEENHRSLSKQVIHILESYKSK